VQVKWHAVGRHSFAENRRSGALSRPGAVGAATRFGMSGRRRTRPRFGISARLGAERFRASARAAAPAVALLTAGAASFTPAAPGAITDVARADESVPTAHIVQASTTPVPAAERYVLSPRPGDAVLRRPNRTENIRMLLPTGVAPENGLQIKTILAARSISAAFPEIITIGGVRPDALQWHPHGQALDVMIPDYHSQAGIELGDAVVAFALENVDRFAIDHVIWRRMIYTPGRVPRLMSDLGGDDANHYSHVHVATKGGGYPTGTEVYLR